MDLRTAHHLPKVLQTIALIALQVNDHGGLAAGAVFGFVVALSEDLFDEALNRLSKEGLEAGVRENGW
jgi:hypothetical protein